MNTLSTHTVPFKCHYPPKTLRILGECTDSRSGPRNVQVDPTLCSHTRKWGFYQKLLRPWDAWLALSIQHASLDPTSWVLAPHWVQRSLSKKKVWILLKGLHGQLEEADWTEMGYLSTNENNNFNGLKFIKYVEVHEFIIPSSQKKWSVLFGVC